MGLPNLDILDRAVEKRNRDNAGRGLFSDVIATMAGRSASPAGVDRDVVGAAARVLVADAPHIDTASLATPLCEPAKGPLGGVAAASPESRPRVAGSLRVVERPSAAAEKTAAETDAAGHAPAGGSYTGVFKRVEKKYRLDAARRRHIEGVVQARLEPTDYPRSRIVSLYFDTPDNLMAARWLEKPLYKEKLRLRVYGDARPGCPVFLEIKKKFKGVVYKRRVPMSYEAAKAYLGGMGYEMACRMFPLANPKKAALSLSWTSLQIAREIDAMRARYGDLRPFMLVSYDRDAYCEAGSELRITFDSNVEAASMQGRPVDLAMPAGAMRLIGAHESLMEVKQAGALPLWLTGAMSAENIYPSSFSKVGTAYLIERGARSA